VEGLFLDLALDAPWETRFKELPKSPELTLNEYQRYYVVFIDAMTLNCWDDMLRVQKSIRNNFSPKDS
jgi:hypothetical protein